MKTTTNTVFLIDGPTIDGLNEDKLVAELEAMFPEVRFVTEAGEYNRLVAGNGLRPVEDDLVEEITATVESLICDDDRVFDPPLLDAFMAAWRARVGEIDEPTARQMLTTVRRFVDREEFGKHELAARNRTGDPAEFAAELLDHPKDFSGHDDVEPGDLWSFADPDTGALCVVEVW